MIPNRPASCPATLARGEMCELETAEDFQVSGDSFEITTAPEDFETVKNSLEEKGFTFTTAEVTMIPQNTVSLTGENASKMLSLIEALEEHDDVQNIHSNFDIDEEEMEKLSQEA